MGFLDNSGDIILDAVLTDHGRQVLSRGDGSFTISYFAVCDDEIDYSLYDSTNQNGSSFYAVSILQSPILEAFTDNAASMKSKLVTYDNNNHLYLPVVKLNEGNSSTSMHSSGSFIVAVNRQTEDDDGGLLGTQVGIGFTQGNLVNGVLFGETTTGNYIRLDQGIDSTALTFANPLETQLVETSYIIQIDNRLGVPVSLGGTPLSFDYVDDDNIAYYTVSNGVAPAIVSDNNNTNQAASTQGSEQTIAGPRGTRVEFRIQSRVDLRSSNFLFEKIGSTSRLDNRANSSSEVYHIDSIVKITGVGTGYTIDIPVRFVKYKS